MKAKEGVLDNLNGILQAELTAVHQYLLHAAMLWAQKKENKNPASINTKNNVYNKRM